MKLCFVPANPKLNTALIESQYPSQAIYENALTVLTRAKGMSSFLCRASVLAHENKREVFYADDVAAVADSLNKDIEAALLMLKELNQLIASVERQA